MATEADRRACDGVRSVFRATDAGGCKATRLLVVANVVVFLAESLLGDSLIARYALWPIGERYDASLQATVGFHPWQLLTSAFLHGGPAHLFLNMLALYSFGREVEAAMGSRSFLQLYFASVLAAALVQLVVVSSSITAYPTVGASGGVFGVLLAFARFFPHRRVLLLLPPIPMPAWLLVTLYALVELANGVFGTQAGIAHFAHLGGMAGAWLVLRRHRLSDLEGG